jgi:hypothetical protein
MSRAEHAEVSKPEKPVSRRLTFGIVAAPVAWFLFEVASFVIIGRNCRVNGGLLPWHWVALGVVTVLCIGLALAGAVTAYRVFKGWRRNGRITRAEGWDRIEFASVFGVFTSLLLLLNIIYFSVLPLVLEPCVRVT